jgi:hypothetical protein
MSGLSESASQLTALFGFGLVCSQGAHNYFPFHVQLDYSLTIRCPEYLNQLALVDYVCAVLPAGVSLYVKEHPASIGGFGCNELRRLVRRHIVGHRNSIAVSSHWNYVVQV